MSAAILVAVMFGALGGLGVAAVVEWWRARSETKAVERLENLVRLARGVPGELKRGWLERFVALVRAL